MGTERLRKSFSWTLAGEDLKNQVENYRTLEITKSYRGKSVLIVAALLSFSLLLSLFGVYASTEEILSGLIVYIPVLIFAYRGHRWAIVALMVLWTAEKGYQLITGGGSILPVIVWLVVMPYFVKALKVENERRKKQVSHG
jgi:hypothetical protein